MNPAQMIAITFDSQTKWKNLFSRFYIQGGSMYWYINLILIFLVSLAIFLIVMRSRHNWKKHERFIKMFRRKKNEKLPANDEE